MVLFYPNDGIQMTTIVSEIILWYPSIQVTLFLYSNSGIQLRKISNIEWFDGSLERWPYEQASKKSVQLIRNQIEFQEALDDLLTCFLQALEKFAEQRPIAQMIWCLIVTFRMKHIYFEKFQRDFDQKPLARDVQMKYRTKSWMKLGRGPLAMCVSRGHRMNWWLPKSPSTLWGCWAIYPLYSPISELLECTRVHPRPRLIKNTSIC